MKLNKTVKIIPLGFSIWKTFGFRTLWRKAANKLTFGEEERYSAWIEKNEPSLKQLEDQKVQSSLFSYRPLISVIMPVFNPPKRILQEAIESVLKQTYDVWELCLIDGSDKASRNEIKAMLEDYSKKDLRIKVFFSIKNNGISGNSNKALEIAQGEFVALLDHDDQLAPFAFYKVVQTLNQFPGTDILYSDRDLLSENGQRRYRPFFKPDWSPELLVSVNYLIHLCVIRRSLVEAAGGFVPEMDGAQDWDLFFKVTERTPAVVHIPEILYHWRVGPTSAAWSSAAKPYLYKAQFKAIKNHFYRKDQEVEVSLARTGFIKINWTNTHYKKASIIIIAAGRPENLKKCLRSILTKTSYPNYEILLVCPQYSESGVRKLVSDFFDNHSIRVVPWGKEDDLPKMKKLGVERAEGEVMVFWDGRLEVVDSDWLKEFVGWADQKEIGAVGGKILKSQGRLLSSGTIITNHQGHQVFSGLKEYFGLFGSSEWIRNYQAVSGAFMAIRKELVEQIVTCETASSSEGHELEFFIKLRKLGYRVVSSPYARVRIIESPGSEDCIINPWVQIPEHFFQNELPDEDPYFNRNLLLTNSIPEINPSPFVDRSLEH